MKNVVGLFDNMRDAEAVVRDLRDAGVVDTDISFAGRNADAATMESNEYIGSGHSEAAEGAGFGATGGTVVGGLTGLLVGLGAIAIPGVGPVIAAGTLATALGSAALGAGIGAATGGLLGALVGAGIPEEDANVYSEGIRRGGALVMAKVDDNLVDTALDIMDRYNVVDIDERSAEYRSGGWSRYDENAEPYTGTMTPAAPGAMIGTPAGVTGTTYDQDRAYDTAGATANRPDYSTTGDADSSVDRGDYDRSSKLGTAGGAVAGAATGAAIGSAGGPVGTVVGGVAGAITGGGVGAAGDAAGAEASDNDATGSSYNTTSAGGPAYGSATDRSHASPGSSTRRSRLYDLGDSDTRNRSVGGSEGTRDTTAARIENATEQGLDTDLNRDGDVGRRGARDNY